MQAASIIHFFIIINYNDYAYLDATKIIKEEEREREKKRSRRRGIKKFNNNLIILLMNVSFFLF